MTDQQIVFVIYDSIENSVFSGQVLAPLVQKKRENPSLSITIITFEKTQPHESLIQTITDYDITLVMYRRLPFLGSTFLYRPTRTLQNYLFTQLNQTPYTLIARGPHAGWISINAALDHALCHEMIIQARGLLADEYMYVQAKKKEQSYLNFFLKYIRFYQYKHLEKVVYTYSARYCKKKNIRIEAVSEPLKKYLTSVYPLPDSCVTIAVNDIPPRISLDQKTQWRVQVRTELKIGPETTVYCYNGSAKEWQCPQETVQFFKDVLEKNENSFLLILTQQKNRFTQLLQEADINPSHYYLCTIAHSEIFRYLASCDYGIIFREPNIINWVSRPTKVLEYEAVNIPIVHNASVAILTENPTYPTWKNYPI